MKVLHVCLASFYIDNYSYQENMLPKYHKRLGLEVEIIASLVSFDENGKSCLLEEGSQYFNEYGIPVTRLEYKKSVVSKKLRKYEGVYEAILKAKPNIIFIHGCQFLDIKEVIKYIKQNRNVKVYVDNHADFSNSAKTWLSKNVLHKVIWKKCAHMIEPYVTKFYGVLPARVDFLKNLYKLPKGKIELLLMGADDDKILEAKKENKKILIREKYGIKPNDFLIITGGKIDPPKQQTLYLMEAVQRITDVNLKLLVFGSVTLDLKEKLNSLVDGQKVQYIGWLNSEEVYEYFLASELGVFPGRHSVLWEQAVGTGLPCIFKHWDGTTHIDVGGNCQFLYDDSVEEIINSLTSVIEDNVVFNKMKKKALEGIDQFSYKEIAKKSIGI
ncbi:glycosyltransferase [Bacillaceae bacterium IKA-2]|nr:glycosyltransferase [Bacillaceae bacterium IKA-2]